MVNLAAMPSIAHFDIFDNAQTDFSSLVEPIQRAKASKSASQKAEAKAKKPASVAKTETKKAAPKLIAHDQNAIDPTSIDLTDPSQVALAMANYERLNMALHKIAGQVSGLEHELMEAKAMNESLSADLQEANVQLDLKKQMLDFATTAGIGAYKKLALRAGQGAAAAFGAIVVIAYLLA